jgi:hypothetical protein
MRWLVTPMDPALSGGVVIVRAVATITAMRDDIVSA